jgi:hypothetical protein
MILQAIYYNSLLFTSHTLAVEVGFDQQLNFVNESAGSYEVCVFLSGQIERNVSVQIVGVPAISPGILNQLQSHTHTQSY